MRKCRVYVARAMSGRPYADVVADAEYDRLVLEAAGFEVLCPVKSEGVTKKPGILTSPKEIMDIYWKRDRDMIESADAMLNMSPHTNSIGVAREHGLMQYGLRRPVVSVFPEGKMPAPGAICYYEDFLVTDSIIYAAERLRKWWREKNADETEGRSLTRAAGEATACGDQDGQPVDEDADRAPAKSRRAKGRRPRNRAAAKNSRRKARTCRRGCRLCATYDLFRGGE